MSREAVSEQATPFAEALTRVTPLMRNALIRNAMAGMQADLARAIEAMTKLASLLEQVPCPVCGQDLDYRGPFDGRESSTGVTAGHEGFGDTYLCEQGHWFTAIPVAGLAGGTVELVSADRILTVVE